MRIRVNFNYKGEHFQFERESNDLDRNYNDEPYAYILEDCYHFYYGGFEINLLKDENGNFTHEAYVNVFEDWDDNEPIETITDLKINFVHEL